MDFDIGNLIYIIATLVAILIGVLGKKKKPAGGGSQEGFPGKRGNLFEMLGKELEGYMDPDSKTISEFPEERDQLVEQDFGEEKVETAAEPVYRTFSSFDEGRFNLLADRMDSNMDMEGMSSTEEIQVIDLDEDEGRDYFEVIRDFDLESAVIYSAVINRIEY